jgi:hypothetical protein
MKPFVMRKTGDKKEITILEIDPQGFHYTIYIDENNDIKANPILNITREGYKFQRWI